MASCARSLAGKPLLLLALLTPAYCTCAEIAPNSALLNETFVENFETPTKPWNIAVANGQVSREATPASKNQKVWDLSRFQRLSIRAMRQKTGTAAVRL